MAESRRLARVVLAAVATATALASCGSEGPTASGSGADCATADYIVPSGTLEDLVTYADEVAVVEVVDDEVVEYDAPNDGLDLERGRKVTIDVDEVVWTAPQQRDVPSSVTFTTRGWVGGDPSEGPLPSCDQPALEVGQRYLVGMVEYRAGDWAPMTGPFVLEVDEAGTVDGVVADGPLSPYDGATPEDVGAALAEVEPDPAIAPYRDQPGGLRFQAAQ